MSGVDPVSKCNRLLSTQNVLWLERSSSDQCVFRKQFKTDSWFSKYLSYYVRKKVIMCKRDLFVVVELIKAILSKIDTVQL